MEEEIIVLNILKQDLDNCKDFMSNEDCLIATAVKRQLGAYDVSEGVNYINIDGLEYNHETFDCEHHDELVSLHSGSELKPEDIILTLKLEKRGMVNTF